MRNRNQKKMFTLEKELLGRQEEAPKDGMKEEKAKSHGLGFSRGFSKEVRINIKETWGWGTAVKFTRHRK